MASVNDFITFLNSSLGLKIPVLPLTGFPAFVVALWKRGVLNWSPGSSIPSILKVDVSKSNPLDIPIGAGSVKAVDASILTSGGAMGSPPKRAPLGASLPTLSSE